MAPWPGLYNSEKFLKLFEPPDYLIDGILQRGYLYTATGMTGSGKTAVWLRIAAHLLLGREIGGLKVKKTKGLYLAGENPTDVQMRWAALAKEMDFDAAEMPIWFSPGAFALNDWMPQIRDMLGDDPDLGFVVTDTAQAFFTGDNENDNKQMVDFADSLRTFTKFKGRPAVIVPSHPTKNTANVLVPRGGGSFLNAVDGNFTHRRRAGETYTRLHWAGKFRGPPFEELRFQLEQTSGPLCDSEGKELPTVLARPISAAEAQKIDAEDMTDASTVLQACRDFPGHSYKRLADEIGWYSDGGRTPNKSRVWRAMKKLEAEGKVAIDQRQGWKLVSQVETESETD